MKFFNKLWNKSKLIRIIIHIISFLLGFKFYFLLKKVPDFVTTDHLIDPVEDLDGTKYYPVFKFIDDGSRCTGFVISPNHALTAAHCLSDISKKNAYKQKFDKIIEIYPFNRSDKNIMAYAIAFDTERDLAVLEGDFSQFQSFYVDLIGTYIPNNFVMTNYTIEACGYPYFGYLRCSNMTFNHYSSFDLIFTGGHFFSGMSGGPIIVKVPYMSWHGLEYRSVVVGLISSVSENECIASNVLGLDYDLSDAKILSKPASWLTEVKNWFILFFL